METQTAVQKQQLNTQPAAFPRLKRLLAKSLLVLYDLAAVVISMFLTLLAAFPSSSVNYILQQTQKYAPWLCIVYIGLFTAFGLYNSLWRYNGFSEANNIVVSFIIGTCLCLFANAIASYGAPVNVIIMASMLSSGSAVVSRFGYRFYRHAVYRPLGGAHYIGRVHSFIR